MNLNQTEMMPPSVGKKAHSSRLTACYQSCCLIKRTTADSPESPGTDDIDVGLFVLRKPSYFKIFYDIQQWIIEKRKMFPPKADFNILTQSATQTELVELVNCRTEFGSNNAIRKRCFLCFEGIIFVLLWCTDSSEMCWGYGFIHNSLFIWQRSLRVFMVLKLLWAYLFA